jgi:hypothetical protein
MQPGPVRRRVPASALAVATLLACVATLLAPAPALAAPPVPATPRFSAAIEDYAPYQGGSICDPVDRPGAKKLAGLIRETYGADQVIGIARNACYTSSEHNDGRALDWMNDAGNRADKARVQAFLGWLLATDQYGNKNAMARRLGVMYIIWNRKIWRAYSPVGWGDYTGSVPHTDHVHISLSVDGASGRTSFWTGVPLAKPCAVSTPTTAAPAVVTDPMNFVPVAATRVLATQKGVGSVNGVCRLWAPQDYGSTPTRVDAQVTGIGAVPSAGVAAVALQVSMREPTWSSYLRAGPTGGGMPGAHRVSAGMNQTSTASIVVPVGADGKVSFATSYGATDLVVSVVGYYVDPNAPAAVLREIAATGGDRYHPLPPARLLSGDDVTVGGGGKRRVTVAGTAGVDPAASAAVVSVTVRGGRGRGAVYVYPAGAVRPQQPLAEYRRSAQTVQATVPLGRGGALVVENVGRTGRQLDVDLVGSYEPLAVSGGLGLSPRRKPATVVATDRDRGLRRLDAGVVKSFSVAGVVPDGTRAVLLEVTVQDPSATTQLRFWRGDLAQPGTVDLTVNRGGSASATLVAPVDANGEVTLTATAGTDLDLTVAVTASFR